MKGLALALKGLLAFAVLGLACHGRAEVSEPFGTLSVDEVEKIRAAPDVRVFDANSADTYAKGHLPGAKFVELKSVQSSLPADKSLRLVFYCKNPH